MKRNNVLTILDSAIKANANAFDFNCDFYKMKYHKDCMLLVNLDDKGNEINFFVVFFDDIDDITIEKKIGKNGTPFYRCVYTYGENQYVHCVPIVE